MFAGEATEDTECVSVADTPYLWAVPGFRAALFFCLISPLAAQDRAAGPGEAERMNEGWIRLAELEPYPDGYPTEEAVSLMRRIQRAVERAGESEESARVRLVLVDGGTVLRFETRSRRVFEEFHHEA